MKRWIKHRFSEWGILPAVDLSRRLPDTARWIKGGCAGPAPPPVKRIVLSAYVRRFGLQDFVETGTHYGDTLAYMAASGRVSCTSIELAEVFYASAAERFRTWPNVSVLHGDSGAVLPELVSRLKRPALFWLDGHYSGGNTALGPTDTPISDELRALLDHPIKTHVILIDDARCFDGTKGYPYLDKLLLTVRSTSNYHIEVSADIIRLTPCSAAKI